MVLVGKIHSNLTCMISVQVFFSIIIELPSVSVVAAGLLPVLNKFHFSSIFRLNLNSTESPIMPLSSSLFPGEVFKQF